MPPAVVADMAATRRKTVSGGRGLVVVATVGGLLLDSIMRRG
jgi:hypothetical protein